MKKKHTTESEKEKGLMLCNSEEETFVTSVDSML
jgi:hypothetical protein